MDLNGLKSVCPARKARWAREVPSLKDVGVTSPDYEGGKLVG